MKTLITHLFYGTCLKNTFEFLSLLSQTSTKSGVIPSGKKKLCLAAFLIKTITIADLFIDLFSICLYLQVER